jgi:hypothetical protein
MVKPDTFLLKSSEKSFHKPVPVRFPFVDKFLGVTPIFCAGNLIPGQEYRSVFVTNLQSRENGFFGAISSHYGLIQCVRRLQRPAETVKTISCNLSASVVDHRNQRTSSILTTVNPRQIRRPEFIRSIHRGPHHLSRFFSSSGTVTQQKPPTFHFNNPEYFLFVSQRTFIKPQVCPNPPVTKRFFVIQNVPYTNGQFFIQYRLFNRILFSRSAQCRTVQTEGSRNHRFGVTHGCESSAQSSCPVLLKRATSFKISTCRVNWPILRSNLPISLSEGSFGRLTCSSDLPASRNRSRRWNNLFWLMPLALANSTAFDPFNNSKATDVFRLAVQLSPFFNLGSGKLLTFHRPQFEEKMSTSQGRRDDNYILFQFDLNN